MNALHHISDSDFTRYHFDTIRGQELAIVEEHLLWCLECVRREEEICAELERAHMDHISIDDLELYHLGHIADASTIAGIEQHVSECQHCADRTLAIQRFVHLVRDSEIREGQSGTHSGLASSPVHLCGRGGE
jgi:hypothetical protein